MSEVLEEFGTTAEIEQKNEEFPEPENSVINILGKLHNPDLEATLMGIVKNHFENLPESQYSNDIYKIPDLTSKLWDGYHSYENTNVVTPEICRIFRTEMVPEIVKTLTEYTVKQKSKNLTQ